MPGICAMSSSKRKFIHIQERPLREAARLLSLSFPTPPPLFQLPQEAPLASVLPRREAITSGREVKYGDVRISNPYNIAGARPPLRRFTSGRIGSLYKDFRVTFCTKLTFVNLRE